MIRAPFLHGVLAMMLVTTACGAPASPPAAQAPPAASSPAGPVTSETAPSAGRVILLTIDGNHARGPEVIVDRSTATLTIKQGERVTLRWSSPNETMLHLHGYDLKASVPAAGTADMPLLAKATGRFAVELHGGSGHVGTAVLYLHVIP